MAAADYESEREFRRIWHTYIGHVAAPKGAEWISTGPAPDPATGTPGQVAKRAGDRDRPPGWPGPRQRCGDARSPGRPAREQSGPGGQLPSEPAGTVPLSAERSPLIMPRKATADRLAGQTDPNEKLTVRELCAELKISRSTFYDWRQKGRGPRCIRLPNGDLRISRRDLDAWLGAQEVA